MATSITARRAGQGTSVLDIGGDITSGSEAALMSAYGEATGARTVLLIRAKRANQRLLACGLSEHYRQIFELTRLDDAIGIFPDEAAALQAV